MGLTTQERQDRIWNKALALRDKANKDRAFNSMLDALRFIVNDCPEAGEDAVLSAKGYNMACEAIKQASNN